MTSTLKRATAELWEFPLSGPTGGSGITAVDVIVVDIEDSEGVTGTGFSYVLGGGGRTVTHAARDMLARFVEARAVSDPCRTRTPLSNGHWNTPIWDARP